MKRLAALIAALGMAGCATRGALRANDEMAPATDAVIHLFGKFSTGQACAVGPTVALTAAHIPDRRPWDMGVPLYPSMWSDEYGNQGLATTRHVEQSRDIAVMVSERPFLSYVVPASKEPVPGERLWLVGYDWRSVGRAYAPRVHQATVTRIQATHIIMRTDAEKGSSGSCVLNAAGELVGINVGYTEVYGGTVGIAVGVYADLFPSLEMPDKKEEFSE